MNRSNEPPAWSEEVGVTAASPEGGGFDVVLRGFELSAGGH